MFRPRSTDFDTRASNIAGHLRAIEKELGGIGRSAGQRASAGASATGDHIADAIGPILSAIIDRFGRGQRVAVDQAASFGNDAIEVGVGEVGPSWSPNCGEARIQLKVLRLLRPQARPSGGV